MIEYLEKLMRRKKSLTFYANVLSSKFNKKVTEEEVANMKREIRKKRNSFKNIKLESTKENFETKEQHHVFKSSRPLSKEELEELVGVDNKTSFISNIWSKSHKEGVWTYSILVSYKGKESKAVEGFQEFLKTFVREKPLLEEISELQGHFIPDKEELNHCLVLSLTDFHLDKLTLSQTTIEEKVKTFKKVLMTLTYSALKSYNVGKIVFVIGNDFFHTDTFFGTTTKGTPQDVATSWFNAYEKGFELLVWAIDFLNSFCKDIEVVHVMSNHDRTKGYYLAHALETYYSNTPEVVFNRTADHTKVATYGVNFLGFHHGDVSNLKDLPLYFASKYPKEWGSTKRWNISVGHLHHRKEFKFMTGGTEINSVRIKMLPSLSGPDKYHEAALYDTSVRAGVALVYHKDKGYVAEIEESL